MSNNISKKSNHKVIIAFFIFFVSFFLGWLNNWGFQGEVSDSLYIEEKINIQIARTQWEKKIEEIGAENAYFSFINKYKNLTPNIQHPLAHVFGELLYKKKGLSGVSVCDQSFAFGCYHEFLGQAIREHGFSVIDILNLECTTYPKDQMSRCQHGTGHGILAYSGYEYENLVFSLKLCDTLRVHNSINGCYGGIFMEYNMKRLLDAPPRSFDNILGPHEPCTRLPEMYQEECYFWLPQWWFSVFFDVSNQTSSKISIFTQLGKFCLEVENSNTQTQCFRGIGKEALRVAAWEVSHVREICKKMPSPNGELKCLASAAGRLRIDPQYKDIAYKLCQVSDPEDGLHCLEISKISYFSGSQPEDVKEYFSRIEKLITFLLPINEYLSL